MKTYGREDLERDIEYDDRLIGQLLTRREAVQIRRQQCGKCVAVAAVRADEHARSTCGAAGTHGTTYFLGDSIARSDIRFTRC